jgi:hypothetical protein
MYYFQTAVERRDGVPCRTTAKLVLAAAGDVHCHTYCFSIDIRELVE